MLTLVVRGIHVYSIGFKQLVFMVAEEDPHAWCSLWHTCFELLVSY